MNDTPISLHHPSITARGWHPINCECTEEQKTEWLLEQRDEELQREDEDGAA